MCETIINIFKGFDSWQIAVDELKQKRVKEYVVDPTLSKVEDVVIKDEKMYIPPNLETLISELLKSMEKSNVTEN